MAEVGGDGDQSEAKSRQGSYDRGIATAGLVVGILTLVATIVTLVVAFKALDVAVSIPVSLDEAAQHRASVQSCEMSIFSLRDGLVALRRGYNESPADKANRLADWDGAESALSQASIVCEAELRSDSDLISNFKTLSNEESAEGKIADQGNWDEGNTLALIAWTDEALTHIVSQNE